MRRGYNALMLAYLGKQDAAISEAKRAVSQHHDDAIAGVYMEYQLARVYVALGQTTSAARRTRIPPGPSGISLSRMAADRPEIRAPSWQLAVRRPDRSSPLMPDAAREQLESSLVGHYMLERELGCVGMAAVYLTRDWLMHYESHRKSLTRSTTHTNKRLSTATSSRRTPYFTRRCIPASPRHCGAPLGRCACRLGESSPGTRQEPFVHDPYYPPAGATSGIGKHPSPALNAAKAAVTAYPSLVRPAPTALGVYHALNHPT